MEIVKEMYLQGASFHEITEKTGLTRRRIEYMVLHKFGLPKRKRQNMIRPENVQKVLRLVHWGYEPLEISEDEGIPFQEVRQIIEVHGNQNIPQQIERSQTNI